MTIAAATRTTRNEAYLAFVATIHPLRPIRSSAEHRRAKHALRSIAADKRQVAVDYKEVLTGIIVAYERGKRWFPNDSRRTAADIVRHLLAEHRLSINAFAKQQGLSQSALSDMLNGKREWSKAVIVNVADYFKLNRGIFLDG